MRHCAGKGIQFGVVARQLSVQALQLHKIPEPRQRYGDSAFQVVFSGGFDQIGPNADDAGLFDQILRFISGDYHYRGGAALLDLAGRFQPGDAFFLPGFWIHHVQVHHHYIGAQTFRETHGLRPIIGVANHFVAELL